MFVHSVFFWLKKDMTAEQLQGFEKGLESLTTISSVAHGWYGTPAETDRPIIDRSYDYGLTIVNKDHGDQMAYQEDPVHDEFRDTWGPSFDKVVIYDYE